MTAYRERGRGRWGEGKGFEGDERERRRERKMIGEGGWKEEDLRRSKSE